MQPVLPLTLYAYTKDVHHINTLTLALCDSSQNIFGYWTPKTKQWHSRGNQCINESRLEDVIDNEGSEFNELFKQYANKQNQDRHEAMRHVCNDALTFIEDNIANQYQQGNVEIDMLKYVFTVYATSAKPLTARVKSTKPKVIKSTISIWI